MVKRILIYCLTGISLVVAYPAFSEIAVIVHPNNSIESLSKTQVEKIYLGKVTKFPNRMRAIAIDQPELSRTRDTFYNKVIGRNDTELKIYWSNMIFAGDLNLPLTVDNDEEVKQLVAQNVNFIAYVDAEHLDESVKPVLLIK